MPPAIWPRSRNVEQIDLYDPDVIIVCGTDTLQAMAPDMGLVLAKPAHTVKLGGAVAGIHAWRGKCLLWAPHPAAHLPPEKWVDAVVKAAAGGGEREAGGEHNSLTLLKIIKIRHLIAERKRLTL